MKTNNQIKETEKERNYKFKLSNGDWLQGTLKELNGLIEVNGLDIEGCLASGRLRNLNEAVEDMQRVSTGYINKIFKNKFG